MFRYAGSKYIYKLAKRIGLKAIIEKAEDDPLRFWREIKENTREYVDLVSDPY